MLTRIREFTVKHFVVSLILLMWVVAMIVALAEKTVMNGPGNVFIYFTNWAWTMQLIFYSLSWAMYFLPRIHDYVIVTLFFMANGLAYVIAILVQLVIAQRPTFITNFFEKYSASIVIIANDIFHVLPVIIILMYILGARELIHRAMRSTTPADTVLRTLLAIYQIFSPILLMLIYALAFDYREVYEVDIPMYQIAVTAVGTCIIFNGIPWYFFTQTTIQRRIIEVGHDRLYGKRVVLTQL